MGSISEKADIQSNVYIHESSYVDSGVSIGANSKIWHFSHLMSGVKIGSNCSFGQNCVIGPNVTIGNNVKVQNNVSIYEGLEIEDDVFLGPSCVLTNVTNPRSQVTRKSLYEKTLLKKGCTIGANATIVCGITIGKYAFISAGAVVSKDVPDYALMMGVPAKQKGWMSRHGHILKNCNNDNIMLCPESGLRYKLIDESTLKCIDIDEYEELPDNLKIGHKFYDEYKKI